MPPQLKVGKAKPKPGYGSPRVLQQGYGPGGRPAVKPKPKPLFTQAQVRASLAANPQATFGPSPSVDYGVFPGTQAITAPRVPSAARERPDMNALIAGDWEVQDAESTLGARMAGLRSDFTQRLRQALIGLGTPDTAKLGKFGSYIDPETIQQAAANKYSANAQIAAGEQKQRRQMEAALAARGALSTGQLTKSSGDIAGEAEKSRYAALQDFLSGGEQGLGQLSEEEYALNRAIAQARANAAARAAEYGFNEDFVYPEEPQVPGVAVPGAPVRPKPVPKPKAAAYASPSRLQQGYGPGGRPAPAPKPKPKAAPKPKKKK